MPQFSESVDIRRPPEDVWRTISTPERWFEGYVETRSRSAEYPAPGTRDDHLFRTRMKEEVEARVTRSEAPKLAAPIASRDIRKRWETSLRHLKAAAEEERR
jgi:uncharacterized protein YndB with AHSA1/START domain